MDSGARLYLVYRALLERYGHRHWWPAETPFEMMVGAILTQNVSWANAATAISNLKRACMLSPAAISKAPPEELARMIRPTRFMNLKANRLKRFVEWYSSEFGAEIGSMSKTEIWRLRKMLLTVNGIGEETADCIILYACNLPVFVVDAYTHRIFKRLGFIEGEITYGELQSFFMHSLPHDAGLFKDYHAQLVHLAKDVCRKTPLCSDCPLRRFGRGLRCKFALSSH